MDTDKLTQARQEARYYLLGRLPLWSAPDPTQNQDEKPGEIAFRRLNQRGLLSKQIIKAVCQHTGVSVDEIKGSARPQNISRARRAAIYLLHKHCVHLTPSGIGRLLCKHHHTVAVALEHVKANTEAYRDIIDVVERKL